MPSLPTDILRQQIAAASRREQLDMAEPPPAYAVRHFVSVADAPVKRQSSTWSDRITIADASFARAQTANGFLGEISVFSVPNLTFMDSRTDPVIHTRSSAHISRDHTRDFALHVMLHGVAETVASGHRPRKSEQFVPGLLALDMGQPFRFARPTCARVLIFFVPRSRVEAVIPDAEALHGRVVAYPSPITRLLQERLQLLNHGLAAMPDGVAEQLLNTCVDLILAAYGRQTRLDERGRAAASATLRAQVLRHIQQNLHEDALSPDSILQTFRLARPTLYRMFQNEGGLASYIRNCRLREAAHYLVRMPQKTVAEIAYLLCFGRPAEFSRAFRQLYGMTPQEFRALGFDIRRTQ